MCNGLGVGVSVYVSGCHRHCKNCHNPDAQDFNYGRPYEEEREEIIDAVSKPYINRLTIVGGEPFENQDDIVKMLNELNLNNVKIWCYTGYSLDNIKDTDLANKCDYIVDGEYIDELRTTTKGFYGSTNQRVWKRDKEWIDVTNDI